jgi:predicted transcriptional regulator
VKSTERRVPVGREQRRAVYFNTCWADKGERQQPGGEVDCFENNRRYNQIEMPATNSRDRMIEALRELPPDATVDDAIERLVFLAKIEAGLTELDRGEGIPHDEVRRRLGV